MKISESMISLNQNYINYWTAKSSYDDLNKFVSKYTEKIGDENSYSYDCSCIFEREYSSEAECLENYCIRAKLVKLATETCELFCKAILIDNGKNWGDMKSFGHNLLSCYNALNEEDKNLIECVPLEYMISYPVFYGMWLSPPVGCEKNYKDEYLEEYPIPLTDFLNSFAKGKILPNIKARYPGQSIVDFNEQFILALAKLLYSFITTKELQIK